MMDLGLSEKLVEVRETIRTFVEEKVEPVQQEYHDEIDVGDRWSHTARQDEILNSLKDEARRLGLWNFFLPESQGGAGISNLEYAHLAEIMGRSRLASEAFNCSAPDTGNMEVLERYGSEAQKKQWLEPLLAGEIRSAFAMTEPEVASSDATNIETRIERDGDDYVINGRKFYISGAMRKTCEIMIVMGKTDPDNPNRHQQQSQILVPTNTPGVNIVRPMKVFGYDDAPEGHAEVVFENVRVPKENMILGEGRGFEIAQGRLGPGRIHHCMRLIGAAQEAFELMAKRVNERVVFGQPMSKQGSVREDLAKSWCEIEQARLMTLKAADTMDREGNKVAKDLIAMIKVVAPNMALNVIDRAIQVHGAVGLSQDTPLVNFFSYARTLRLADGPDQVHMMQLGRNLAKYFA